MWVTTHFFAGAALTRGVCLRAAPWAGIASHAALDAVPHWDYTRDSRRRYWAALDVAATTVALLGLLRTGRIDSKQAIGGLAGALPDLDVLGAVLPVPDAPRLFPSHLRGFPHGRAGMKKGILVQLGLVLLALGTMRARS